MLVFRRESVASKSNTQMRELDSFGPKARAAFNMSPRLPDISTFRSEFARHWYRSNVDRDGVCNVPDIVWTEPHIDEAFASYINDKIVALTGHSIEWHDLKPKRLLNRRGPPTASSGGTSRS